MSSSIEISPLSTEISRHAKYELTDGRAENRKHSAFAAYWISQINEIMN